MEEFEKRIATITSGEAGNVILLMGPREGRVSNQRTLRQWSQGQGDVLGLIM